MFFGSDRPWDPVNDVYQYENGFVVQTQTRHKTPHLRATSLSSLNKSVEKKKLRIPRTVEESDSSGHGLHRESDSSDYVGECHCQAALSNISTIPYLLPWLRAAVSEAQGSPTAKARRASEAGKKLELKGCLSVAGSGLKSRDMEPQARHSQLGAARHKLHSGHKSGLGPKLNVTGHSQLDPGPDKLKGHNLHTGHSTSGTGHNALDSGHKLDTEHSRLDTEHGRLDTEHAG